MKDKKLKPSPAIALALVATVLVGGGWFLSRRFQITVGVVSPSSDSVPIIKTAPSLPVSQPPVSPSLPASPGPTTQPDPGAMNPERTTEATPAGQGSIRVRNQSGHPVRVALLMRQRKPSTTNTTQGTPAHWDFAPSEGSLKGLLLSLPNQMLQARRGDVLVAFAQDGSQRYWGPYVVGESDQPIWNRQLLEWELTLEH